MTNLENIRNSTPESLAKFLHTIEALAIIEGKADSEEELLDWLFAELSITDEE